MIFLSEPAADQQHDPAQQPQLDPRRCSILREDGTQCKGWRVKGEELCAGHLGKGIAQDPEGYGRAGAAVSAQVARDRAEERRKTPQEAMRAVLVQHAEDFAHARRDIALDPKASPSDRLAAMRDLENRVLGKPTEKHELSVTTPQTVQELEGMSRAELTALLAELELQRGGSLLELVEHVDPPLTAYSEPSDS